MKLSWQEVCSWSGIALITVIAFSINYLLTLSGPMVAMVWIAWAFLTILFAFFTKKGKLLLSFTTEARRELEKVVWPTRQETIQTTSIVVVMVTVAGFVLWGIDTTMLWMIGKITHLG